MIPEKCKNWPKFYKKTQIFLNIFLTESILLTHPKIKINDDLISFLF